MSKEVALNFLQAMIFSQRTEEMKNENPYFSGGIANQCQQYVVNRAGEIACTYPQILLKLRPNGDKYVISESMFQYLSHLTGVNPCDKKVIELYKPIIQKVEKEALASVLATSEGQNVGIRKK